MLLITLIISLYKAYKKREERKFNNFRSLYDYTYIPTSDLERKEVDSSIRDVYTSKEEKRYYNVSNWELLKLRIQGNMRANNQIEKEEIKRQEEIGDFMSGLFYGSW